MGVPHNSGAYWATWEDRAVLNAKRGELRHLAIRLGRTYVAVVHRRGLLLQDQGAQRGQRKAPKGVNQ
jgi:hypothetical protein